MRPHEEVLAIRFNGGNTCLTAEGHGIVAYVPKAAWQTLFLAAPDMARALRDLLCDPDSAKAQEAAERALLKAGVLP